MMGHYAQAIALSWPQNPWYLLMRTSPSTFVWQAIRKFLPFTFKSFTLCGNRRHENACFVKFYRSVRQVFLFKDIVNDGPYVF